MKTYYKKVESLVFFLLIWVILNENARLDTILIGAAISLLTLTLTNKLVGFDFAEEFYESPFAMVQYFVTLMKEIYKGSFDMFKRIFTKNIHPTFMEYESGFKKELPLVLLSNSVTLVPGTATYERNGSKLFILSAEPDEASVMADTLSLEKSLEKLEAKR
ncbi:MAG: Na+/H+ antiporter subunit E [Turicibacter sp.]|nr:Na+/H+ antiporter subunit E [Turicibacter sp.]